MTPLNGVQTRILHAVINAGGELHNLWKLTDSEDMEYENARQQLLALARMGLVRITNERNQLHIQLNTTVETMPDLPDYPQPNISERDLADLRNLSIVLACQNTGDRIKNVFALLVENARLVAEINEHRRARGFSPRPEVKPGSSNRNGQHVRGS